MASWAQAVVVGSVLALCVVVGFLLGVFAAWRERVRLQDERRDQARRDREQKSELESRIYIGRSFDRRDLRRVK